MYKIKWRKREGPRRFIVVTGLRNYPTQQAAEAQRDIFQRYFPGNNYYIEPA